MLFNSLPFIFGFLPAAIAGYFLLGRVYPRLGTAWMAAASVFFYGWWNQEFVILLLGSVFFNYCAGGLIAREIRKPGRNLGRISLAIAIACDLGLLGYFKYANFFAYSITAVFAHPSPAWDVVLPLGISFFTFTQIAFLVDSYQGKVTDQDLIRYLLFVAYFPHLIAGPIIHHKQVMPQFAEPKVYHINWTNVAAGLTIFIIGLAKKVLLADNFGVIVDPLFDTVVRGDQLKFVTAWAASLAYTLQLYFDFSGYSDMAIGLSLIFNIQLPLNFNSPYKASSIIDFWKRWHMTLSAFLRDYLYIPLGGNRKSEPRRYLNILVTMLLGGLWHGAGWTFVLWGGLHGVFLIVNHAFRAVKKNLPQMPNRLVPIGTASACALTFFCVVVGWAIFRSDSLATAGTMLNSMLGGCLFKQCTALDFLYQVGFVVPLPGDARVTVGLWLITGLLAVWLLPNTQQFVLGIKEPAAGEALPHSRWASYLRWNPLAWWCWLPFGLLTAFTLIAVAANPNSPFLYFQF